MTSNASTADPIATRANELFREQHQDLACRTDRMFAFLMILQWLAGIAVALLISPQTWLGTLAETHVHVWAAALLGGALAGYPVFLVWTRPGTKLTRHTIAVSQMLSSALLIHLTGGRIETHFHVFGSLAFIAFYRDRKVLTTAALVIIGEHLIRGIFWPQSVYGVLTAPIWRSFEHAGWVVFEFAFLLVSMKQGVREMKTIADRQARMESTRARIEEEVDDRTRELQQAEARTRAILETAADGIITIKEQGIIQTFNPAAESIFGYPAADVIGRNVSMLMPQPDRDAHDGYLHNYLTTGDKKIIGIGRQVTGQRKDGTTFPLDLAVSESQGGVFTGIVRDVTERNAIDKMKTEFISTVSHELRTPLTSIRGSLGLLHGGMAGDLPDKATSLIEIAVNNSDRLVRLVNDILDIEKIESGKMDFRFEPQRMSEMIEEAIAANAGFAGQHEVSIVPQETVADGLVMADKDRILQVLTNLISNAVKFSPAAGEIVISASRRDSAIRVEVSDRGPGIPEEFRSRIFGKFAQADSSDVRQQGGTGLGLSISKAIVEKHDGSIGFETETGVGTTFYFEMPALARRSSDRPTPSSEPGPRILVCEDDPDVAHLLSLMLGQQGLQVDTVGDADEARERLATQSYDAMTLDLRLPGVSGLQLLRDLRNETSTQNIPVVVVSADASETAKESDEAALGVVDWLNKPIDQPRLFESVSSALEKASTRCPEDRAPRVLHVEDDEDLASVVGVTLSSVAEVAHAGDLESARRILGEREFDVVLLDLALPDGSGLDLLPDLKSAQRTVPVVVFSAGDPDTRVVERVDASLVKSRTSNQELIDTITSLIKRPDVVGEQSEEQRPEVR